MTAELARIEDQLRRAMEGGAWHGPAVLEQLEGVSSDQAAERPIAGAHTIWELVIHLGGAVQRLRAVHRPHAARPLSRGADRTAQARARGAGRSGLSSCSRTMLNEFPHGE